MAQGSCDSGWTESAQFNENGYHPHFVFFINICRVSVANLNVSADKYILYFASFFSGVLEKTCELEPADVLSMDLKGKPLRTGNDPHVPSKLVSCSFYYIFRGSSNHSCSPSCLGTFSLPASLGGFLTTRHSLAPEVSNDVLEWIMPGSRKDLRTSSS